MKIAYNNNNVVLTGVKDFNLTHIFECGQAFRWNLQDDGSYEGVAKRHALKIYQDNDTVTFFNTSLEDFENVWYEYFDFSNDYSKIKKKLNCDPVLKTAIPYGDGIRILKQDLWETVVSFIISASNNIPRIKKIVELLCANFGDKIYYNGKIFYSFPDFYTISNLSFEDLSVIRAGFRDKYIKAAAEKFASSEISEKTFKELNTKEAKKLLMSVYGIGSKVADCILFFGLSRTDAFPVDVWIKKIMQALYFNNKETNNSDIEKFAVTRFGKYAGFAQQYLFFYSRENLH